jgi:hypothetical protein
MAVASKVADDPAPGLPASPGDDDPHDPGR